MLLSSPVVALLLAFLAGAFLAFEVDFLALAFLLLPAAFAFLAGAFFALLVEAFLAFDAGLAFLALPVAFFSAIPFCLLTGVCHRAVCRATISLPRVAQRQTSP